MKLTGISASIRTSKILLVAAEAKVDLEMNNLKSIAETKSSEHMKKNPNGKIPVLETSDGCIYESNAIMYQVARIGGGTLLGQDALQKAKVNQYVEHVSNELEAPVAILMYGAYGYLDILESTLKTATNDLNNQLKVFNDLLKNNQFLVGDSITLADLYLAAVLLTLYRFQFDDKARKQHSHVFAWFQRVAALPSFVATYGKVHYCKVPQPIPTRKVEKKEKEVKKPAAPQKVEKKVEKKVEEVPVKQGNPLDSLPPSKFNLFDFKTFFVNHNDKRQAMKEFWEMYDAEGYSLWKVKYDKYEGEGEVLHMTNNLLGGFIQRLDTFRKYSFAVHGVYGDEPNLDIKGAWLWRGVDIPFEIKDHVSYEYNFFTKLDHNNPEHRKFVEDMWCCQEEDKDIVDGQCLRTFKYYK